MSGTLSLEKLLSMYEDIGVEQVFVKVLADNDNSKNQIYLGGSLEALNIFPFGDIAKEQNSKGAWRCKAPLDFHWLRHDGASFRAPSAQLIFYPQYPEVRLSGMLARAEWRPSDLIASRREGRVLLFGIHPERRIHAFAADRASFIASQISELSGLTNFGPLLKIPMEKEGRSADTTHELLEAFRRIHRSGWIQSERLDKHGNRIPCTAPQCGGYTLEAELGIIPNGLAEPDYLGWEIKQFGVPSFSALRSARITLMTPQPTGGYYAEEGVIEFVRKYGYPAVSGEAGRLNFGGIHKAETANSRTSLVMHIPGFDAEKGRLEDVSAGIQLVDQAGEVAAEWGYTSLIQHWARKHGQAAYIPSIGEREPEWRYKYGSSILLCRNTDFNLFLSAVAKRKIFYDPGIKVLHANTAKPTSKHRSQFRINSGFLSHLYRSSVWENLS